VIGADGITLDLDGHTIGGDDTPVDSCPEGEWCDVGIVTAGHRGVTIKGGAVPASWAYASPNPIRMFRV